MKLNLKSTDDFASRHIGPDEAEQKAMLAAIGIESLEALINETVPENIRLREPLDLPEGISEFQLLNELKEVAKKNQAFKSFIGLGYYDCIVPAVILRNVFENPGWYTQYTPYQSEISQGRLEALLNFQTMVMDLTAMEAANASLLDEGTAAAEAMTLMHRSRSKDFVSGNASTFFVSDKCLPQTIDILKTRSEPLGIELLIGDFREFEFYDKVNKVYGAVLQYPDVDGAINDYSSFINKAHEAGALVAVAADLLSLALLTPPGEMGADLVFGSSQRFGVPLGYGGPHAAYFATRDAFKRQMPGRIIGVSVDKHGNKAYRMALQTREQHIRRERATSNICTAQALLAIMAGMYAVYHGPKGLKAIAERVHTMAGILNSELKELGYRQKNQSYFDTIQVDLPDPPAQLSRIRSAALEAKMNFRYIDGQTIGITVSETTQPEDLQQIVEIFAAANNKPVPELDFDNYSKKFELDFPDNLRRKTPYLQHPVFNKNHSETRMMRYIKILENRDLSLTTSMIPLGSCTMKLNAASEMLPVSWPEFSNIHPFAPLEQTRGYLQIFAELEAALCEITGFSAVSLQPNSGAQGEYAGLLVIRAYHRDRGEGGRDIVLIPSSAHGTNPASAIMAGMKVAIIKCDRFGNIDVEDLQNKAVEHKEDLAALMVTYPSTHGVFESKIQEICKIIHDNGGQVYMDGANLNAQVGLTSPAIIGADVCHLNLHKTFSIPHGGGGPGMGPIAVAKHLEPYLPKHPMIKVGGEKGIGAISATPWGSPSILLISYAYIKMLGGDGMTKASKVAILNANYIKSRLQKAFPVLYTDEKGRIAHEMIFDLRPFKMAGVDAEDVAKRLMDYGFHAPTISFPVPGTMMIEPTESEAKEELDRFCDAVLAICREIKEIEEGKVNPENNVLKNAPHTAAEVTADTWEHPYSREKAAYPLPYIKENKFWPPVGRIDNVYGDRNLVCACPPIEAYEEEV
ncbi:aminomethyl-transferring glycine dehydrogenase [candidate division KSB1 bacterium]|nr:aminomethyl-transferring glycine dehydrogenase [candidate division KSB1 bacterium]